MLTQIDWVSQACRRRCQKQIKSRALNSIFPSLSAGLRNGLRNERVKRGRLGLELDQEFKSAALGALSRDLDSTVRFAVIDGDLLSDGDSRARTGTDALD